MQAGCREHLRRIRVPAWAVAGSRDDKFVEIARAMAAEGPFEVVTVPDHVLVEERPLALTQIFLSGAEGLLRRLLHHPS